MSLAFVVAAGVAAASSSRWSSLHLLLAGGAVLSISGVSLMLTVTWSGAPAPDDRWVRLQRWCVAGGAAGLVAGRQASLPGAAVGVAAGAYLFGLASLGILLVTTMKGGVERRFDVAVEAYLVAIASGIAAVTIGATMAVHAPTTGLRVAHVTLNLLGLVGLTIGGTMPFFAATLGRSRMAARATPRRMRVALGWQVTALTVAVIGLGSDVGVVAGAGLGAYALGIVGVLWLLPRPTSRQLRWAGPRLVALWAGGAWWAAAVGASAVDAGVHDTVVFGGRWLLVLVVAGYLQIIWGSLAYLLPMLRGGGHERLGEGFVTTRSWVGLAAANVVGASLVVSMDAVAALALALWGIDAGLRAAYVGVTRAERATESTTRDG